MIGKDLSLELENMLEVVTGLNKNTFDSSKFECDDYNNMLHNVILTHIYSIILESSVNIPKDWLNDYLTKEIKKDKSINSIHGLGRYEICAFFIKNYLQYLNEDFISINISTNAIYNAFVNLEISYDQFIELIEEVSDLASLDVFKK